MNSVSPTPSPRRAQLSDLSSLVKLENEVFTYDQLKRSSFRRFILSNNDLWVWEQAGKISGYILVLKRKGSQKARIYSLAVSPESQGQGIGKKLLLHVLSALIGHRFVQLEVKENNLGAIKLYESLGFRVSARLVAFYSDGEDALVWQKSLASGD